MASTSTRTSRRRPPDGAARATRGLKVTSSLADVAGVITHPSYLPSPPCLGHLPRPARVMLLRRICEAIRDDMRERGPDPRLMLLGASLDYCSSLLGEAGADELGDAVDAALAQLDLEMTALAAALRAALHRPGEAALRADAAELLRALFPTEALPDTLVAARGIVRQGRAAERERALDRLGLRPLLHQVDQALLDVDHWLARCRDAPSDELRARARGATRMADALLRRIVGHVAAATDSGDPDQRVRAASLLAPLIDRPSGAPEAPDAWAAPLDL